MNSGNQQQQQQQRPPRQSVADRFAGLNKAAPSWNNTMNNANNEAYRRYDNNTSGSGSNQQQPQRNVPANRFDDEGSSVLAGHEPTNEDGWTDAAANIINKKQQQPNSYSSMLKSRENTVGNSYSNSRDPRDPRNARDNNNNQAAAALANNRQQQYTDADEYNTQSHVSGMKSAGGSTVFSASNVEIGAGGDGGNAESVSNMSGTRTESSLNLKKSFGRGRGFSLMKK
jgi:hypothetical protein